MRKLFSVAILFLAVNAVAQIFFSGGTSPTRKQKVNRILPAPPPPAPSGNYWWVATNGTVNASGSFSDPWSFPYAETQTVARATDYIAFKNSGTYTSGTTNFVVSYEAEPVDADPPLNTFLIQIR